MNVRLLFPKHSKFQRFVFIFLCTFTIVCTLFILAIFEFRRELTLDETGTALIVSERDSPEKSEKSDATTIQEKKKNGHGMHETISAPMTTKKDHPIKAGMTIQLKLAKILKKTKISQKNESAAIPGKTADTRGGSPNTEESKRISSPEPQEIVKTNESATPAKAESPSSSNDITTQNFRSYQELKKELGPTDQNVMIRMLEECNQENTTMERKLVVMEDLEYLVHEVDNAKTFVETGGFTILSQMLKSTDSQLRKWAAFIAGSAAENNPPIKVAALKNGILDQVVGNFQTELDFNVSRKYVFAMSAIIRDWPYAQKLFLQLKGLDMLGTALKQDTTAIKLKIKIITLMTDLLYERRNVQRGASSLGILSTILYGKPLLEKLEEYKEMPLMPMLVKDGWCSAVADLLSISDYDGQEKVMQAMEAMYPDCNTYFVSSVPRLHQLENEYASKLAQDKDNFFLAGLVKLVRKLVAKITQGG